jgi:hypothetical protein
MVRKPLSLLLLLSWLALSGFDLVEDLDFETETSVYSQDSQGTTTEKSLPPYSKQHVRLANNIVESAGSTRLFSPILLRLTPFTSPNYPVLSCDRIFALYKLHHVFLI